MPINTDIRQAIILAVENTGTQAVDQLRASLKVVQEQMDGWNRALEAGTTSTTTYIAAMAKLTASQNEFKAALEVTREAEGRAKRERIEAYAREERELEGVVAATERMKATYQGNAAAATFLARQARDLDSVMEGLAQHEQQAAAATTTFTTAAAMQARMLKEAEAHAAGFASAADMATNQNKKFAFATINVAHAFQDFAQGGLAATINNIPLVTQSVVSAVPALEKMTASLGGAAGLAGGLTIAASGAYLLYTNWNTLMTAFGTGQGVIRPVLDDAAELRRKLEEASKVTEDLGKKTHLSLAELRQYREATAKVKEFNEELERRRDLEAILSGKSKAQREAGSAFREAVAESGGGVARDALDTAIGQQADAKGLVYNEVRGKMTTPKQLAEDLIRQAGEGDTRARGQVLDFLGKAYKPRKGDFASNIRETMPENVAKAKEQAQHDAEAERKRGIEADRRAREEEQEDEKAQRHFDAEELRLQTAKAHWEAGGPAAEERAQKKRDRLAREADANAKRQEREAPGIAKHAREMGYAQTIQAGSGINDEAANEAGRIANQMVEKGANPAQAMSIALQKVLRTLLEQQATNEAMMGMFGPATAQLQQIDQRNAALRQQARMLGGQVRRMGNQRQTRLNTFNGP